MSPLYEYDCECGSRIEAIRSVENRHNVTCKCGREARLLVSISTYRMAEPFSVLAHDGTLLHRRQTTEKTPPPDYRWNNPNLVEA